MNFMSILLSPKVLSVVIFLAALAVLLWKDRENIQRDGILFFRRTERGINLIDKIAKISPRFWRALSTLGIFLSLGAMIVIFFILLSNLIDMFLVPETIPALAVVIPTLAEEPSIGLGYITIPFWPLVISLTSVVVVHELMHGIVGRAEDFPLKSVGWAILGILPAAFVEPEGEEMLPEPGSNDTETEEERESEEGGKPWAQGSWFSRLRVLTAGSFGNFMLAALIGLVLFGISTASFGEGGMYKYNGLTIGGIENQSPAYDVGLRENMTITRINNVDTNRKSDLNRIRKNITLDSSLDIVADNRSYRMVPVPNPNERGEYHPAPIDYILANLEMSFPGSIEVYENNNDFLVSESKLWRKTRWEWIKENYPALELKAEERIEDLEAQMSERPWLGIEVKENRKVREGWGPIKAILSVILVPLGLIGGLNLSIGMANMLPIKPLDGGWVIETLTERYCPEKTEIISGILRSFSITIIFLIFALMGFNIFF